MRNTSDTNMSIPGSGNPSLDLALTRDISSNDKLTANEKKKFRVVNRGSFFKDAWHELGEMYKRNPLVKRRRAEKFRIAAISGDLELLRTAVEDWEIDVNDKNKDGQTALYCAAREGRSKVKTLSPEPNKPYPTLNPSFFASRWLRCYVLTKELM